MQSSSKKRQSDAELKAALLKEGDEWEAGHRGGVETSSAATAAEEQATDAGLELQMVSIRLPSYMVEEFKRLAGASGLKYQPYVRKVLMDHLKKPSIEDRVAELEKQQLRKNG